MKKTLLLIATVLCCAMTMFAQNNNNKISYQAVVRDTENKLVANKDVTVTVKIFDGDAQQPAYTQTYENVHTNLNGLISLQIGPAQSNEAWNGIHWNNARIETTVTLDGADAPLGTLAMPLTAVPYAFYADNAHYADSVNVNVIANFIADQHYITSNDVAGAIHDSITDNISAQIHDSIQSALESYEIQDCGQIRECVADDFAAVYTKMHGDSLALGTLIGAKANSSDVYTKDVMDDKLGAKADTNRAYTKAQSDTRYLQTETDPTVKNSLVTITVNNNTNHPAGSFTLNQAQEANVNITVPTKVGDLQNDKGYITASDVPAQVNADWTATSGAAEIINKPTNLAYTTLENTFTGNNTFGGNNTTTTFNVPVIFNSTVSASTVSFECGDNPEATIDFCELLGTITALENRVNTLEEDKVTTNQRIDTLKNRVDSLKHLADSLAEVTESMKTDINMLAQNVPLAGKTIIIDTAQTVNTYPIELASDDLTPNPRAVIWMYINGVMVGGNHNGVIKVNNTVLGGKTFTYDATKNGYYKLRANDKVTIVYCLLSADD